MEKLKKISKIMNVVFKLVLLIAVIQFVMRLVDLGTNQVALLMKNPGAEYIKLFDIDTGNVKWHFLREQDMETTYFIKGIVLAFFAAVLKLVESVFLVYILGKLLKPMTKGQPYDGTVSKSLRTFGIGYILIGIAENVISYLQASRASGTLSEIRRIFLPVTVTETTIQYSINLGFLFLGVMIFIFSFVFRYGEELQVQVDETL